MKNLKKVLNTSVLVGALGYFVDIYDLLIFSIVRTQSLKDIGLSGDALLSAGVQILNWQMSGMLVGGLLWGVLGDKRGRVSVLFGSIILYSVANIANAWVQDVPTYAFLRFVAGVGLAGELGAAITLVCETLPKELRGYGTGIVAGVGILGAVAAGLVGDFFPWRKAYLLGGVLGLSLLVLRIRMFESGIFEKTKSSGVVRGDLWMLLKNKTRLLKYIHCIFIGVPLWYIVGILVTFSPEIGKALGSTETVLASRAVLFNYLGLSIGDFATGAMSQVLKSRKKVVAFSLAGLTALIAVFLFSQKITPTYYYGICFCMGLLAGYWAVFVTVAAEQFGTNLRATVATSVPNFVRGSVVILTTAFHGMKDGLGIVQSALVVGGVCLALAALSLSQLEETYSKELDFDEIDKAA